MNEPASYRRIRGLLFLVKTPDQSVTQRKWQVLSTAVFTLALQLMTAPAFAKGEACPTYDQLRPLLNSERIQSCFGSYGVEVLDQQDQLRISSLYSLDGDTRTTRTLAISEFATELPASLDTAYQAIRSGGSMGATLEANGWRVDKRHRYLGEVPVTDAFRCMSGLPTSPATQLLAIQVYDLYAVQGDTAVLFALLAELHDPRYLTLPDLKQIYGDAPDPVMQADETTQRMLQRAETVCMAP